MITLVTVLLLLFSIACMFRLAFLIPAMLLVGFLADPLRKLVEGEPVYFVVFVGVAVLSAFIGLFFRNGLSIFEALTRWSPKVRLPLTLFMVLIFIQAMNSFIGYGSLILTGIGAMSYTAPFPAMVVGYFVFDRNERIQQLIKAYLICGALLVAAVCLSFLGLDWAVLKEVGAGLVIYDQGTIVYSHSGFMRSSEIAAWHMATAVCFLIILNVTNRSRLTIPASVVFGLILFVGVVLTGRRKMIMQIVQFCGLYGVLYFYFKRSLSLLIMLLLAFSIFALWLGIELLFPGGYSDSFGIYVARGTSVFGDALDRA
ncbi:MAG: hypothetical protein HOM55_11325, partial [Proteobacteria bacterium]|nr:hypothetical protein [Pseudomonadota bacterium]